MTGPRDAPTTGVATTRLRMWGYAAVLAAMAFSQSAGRMVADTKFDLVTNPAKFLGNALHLWDPSAAFGQIQNQAYGYAWPMGPLFLLGDLAHVPGWVVQRLWWTLLLCAAFFGVVRVAQRLGLGTPLTQVVAGFAFVLTPRITTLLGGTSVEIWPMALAPWVLLPLIVGSERGSVRRAAALSALVVASCGGVNAIAVAAVLPLGVVWILTRAGGPRKWRLLGWWTLFTGLATLWWSGPLLLLGRYSPPFLDYIENATITSIPTGLSRTIVGESDWVAYFADIDYTAGQQLVTTPFLVLDAAAIAALGLVGIALRSNPHQRFLTLGLLVGVALVGFGYSGELAGFFAADRTDLLDQSLAPLRNLHKFDVVLRLPLVLGLAHVLARLAASIRGKGAGPAVTMLRVATGLALLALALPWAQDRIAPRDGVEEVPDYWAAAAEHLASTDDGTVALEIPASAFGVYSWGNTHDDVLQGLADSPWAVRNVIPLAQPGNVVFLDAVTRFVESGHPGPELAQYLAANGVGRLIVRNDLDRFETGAPDPSYVASVLRASPGIELDRSFGPRVGADPVSRGPDEKTRVIEGSGLSTEVGSVDVYDVVGAHAAYLTSGLKALAGDPGSGLSATVGSLTGGQPVLAADAPDGAVGQVLTDGMRRRETNFAAVRWNESDTMAAGKAYQLVGPEHEHRVLDDPERWQTTASWSGQVTSVTASSSEASAEARPPLQIGSHPGAALDEDPATAWRSERQLDPTGEYWQVSFGSRVGVGELTVRLAPDSAPVDRLDLWAGGEHVEVAAPRPGRARIYHTTLGAGEFLRVTAAGRDLGLPGSFAIAEVGVPDLLAQRVLDLPEPDPRFPVDLVSLTRDPDRAACATAGEGYACLDVLAAPGEDGDTLARRFVDETGGDYTLSGTVSLRRTVSGDGLFESGLTARTDSSKPTDIASGPAATLDDDPGTTWVAHRADETLTVRFPRPQRLSTVEATIGADAPVARPTALLVSSGDRERLVRLDRSGRGTLPPWTVRTLDVRIADSDTAFLVVGQQFETAPAGISSLSFGRGLEPARATEQRVFPCGTGPDIAVDGQVRQTSVVASVRRLVRGASVPFVVCGFPTTALGAGSDHAVLARPSKLFRVDTVDLRHVGVQVAATQPVTLHVDGRGQPTSVSLPERRTESVLTVQQNVNEAWVATLDGERLPRVRVAGWKQGFLVPAGASGEVLLSIPADRTFSALLVLGAAGVALVALVVLVPLVRRRPVGIDRPELVTARPGLLDATVALAAGGLLMGWWGLGGVAAALVLGRLLQRRFEGWAVLGGLTFLIASLAMTWTELNQRSWAVEWTQAWSMAALAAVAAGLAGRPRDVGRRRAPGGGIRLRRTTPRSAGEDGQPIGGRPG
ncbi:alpha-(1-_3)-arabinofuranosyltransferase domain-containing protein [Nocardioides sp.]|uniref:alpha-(1->3)-arabinofuranosyltransferase domain-containing protein n=1 Tax=Nocardioides sp. TaxID=35761 RepID=UPI002EDA63EB